MPVYRLKTQVLTPEEEKSISFSGKHPSRFFSFLPGILREVFRVTSSKFFEDKIKWDVGDTSVQFFAIWRGREPKDDRTNVWAQIKLQGVQSLDKEKMGQGVILLTGWLDTAFPYLTVLDKGLYKAYTYFFYNKQRRYYLEEARRQFEQLERGIKREIGLEVD